MFLDDTYFQGELYLPYFKRKTGEAVGSAAIVMQTVAENTLEWFIEKYEQECLERILGREMYKRFVKGLEDKEGPDYGDWLILRDRIFIKRGRYSFSPVANYVYFFVMRSSRTQTAGTGEVKGKADKANNVSESAKLIKAWNELGKMIEEIHAFINENEEKYGALEVSHEWFKGINCFGI